VLRDGAIHGVSEPLLDLVAHEALASVVEPVEIVSQADARLRAPVPSPPSIRDFMAFEEHVVTSMQAIGREVDPVWYEIPARAGPQARRASRAPRRPGPARTHRMNMLVQTSGVEPPGPAGLDRRAGHDRVAAPAGGHRR
jgi:hypothetical protein